MANARTRVRPHKCCVPVAFGAALALSGCNNPAAGSSPQAGPTTTPPAPKATVAFSVKDPGKPVPPDQQLTVTPSGGTLVSVRLMGPDDKLVPGRVVDGVWQTSESTRLVPDATYTWRATAKNADGVVTQAQQEINTLKPKVSATYTVTPDGATVGVGMPVMVRFDSGVETGEMRAEVEKRMSLKVTPAQKGSWGWVDERQLMWRPDTYWKPGTKVSVNAPLTGVQTGKDKWIVENKGAKFTISKRARISKVNLASHVMTVTENGKTIGRYPISAGKPTDSWETRSGTKVITEKHAEYTMDAGTLGLEEDDPDYYKTEVKYAMRVTNTGEFLHAAPWSVWAQGRQNVSHGCVNLGPNDARSVFQQSIIGDVVEFTGSGRRMKPGDGLSVWLFDTKAWHARSALAKS